MLNPNAHTPNDTEDSAEYVLLRGIIAGMLVEKHVPKAEAVAVATTIAAVGDAIRAHGTRGVPSDQLYAVLSGMLSLDSYDRVVTFLVDCRLIKREAHLLIWIGGSIARH